MQIKSNPAVIGTVRSISGTNVSVQLYPSINSTISYIIVPRISAGGKSNSRRKDGVRDGDGEAAQKSPRALNGYADFGVIHFRLPHPFSATGTAPAPCCPHIHRGRCC